MRYIFTRHTDKATLEIAGFGTPYVLSPDTVEPAGNELDVSGYEYSGLDGGYSTASRYRRRPFELVFTIMEYYNNPKGLLQLIAECQAFFDPHNDDLSTILFDMEAFTCSGSYVMRNASVSVPLNSAIAQNERVAEASISFIFGDPYRYRTSGAGVATADLRPSDTPGSDAYGREWATTNGAVWTTGNLKSWVLPAGGAPGEPVTVYLVSEATVRVAIRANGEMTDPLIENLTNGSYFRYTGTIPSGTTLIVDTAGNVLLNGVPAPGVWEGNLTARGGYNTFLLNAPNSNGGSAQLKIAGAF